EVLDGVVDEEEIAAGNARVARAFGGERLEQSLHVAEDLQDVREDRITQCLQLRESVITLRAAGIAGGEDQLPGLGTRRGYREIVGRVRRLAVDVHPHDADVEVVPRKVEVVRITPEEGSRLARHEH